jgi:putative ABC transport system substrate-binding protein
MRRREFIAGVAGAAAWPLATRAQQPTLPVVGFVYAGSADDSAGYAEAFLQGLAQLSWSDGRNLRVDVRWAAGSVDRMRMLPVIC